MLKLTSKNTNNKQLTSQEPIIPSGLNILGPIEISIDDVLLDAGNMRFLPNVGHKLSQDEIKQHLDSEHDVRVLEKMIRRDGQLFFPIFVRRVGKKFVVKDGNRRLRSYQRINEEQKNEKEI